MVRDARLKEVLEARADRIIFTQLEHLNLRGNRLVSFCPSMPEQILDPLKVRNNFTSLYLIIVREWLT